MLCVFLFSVYWICFDFIVWWYDIYWLFLVSCWLFFFVCFCISLSSWWKMLSWLLLFVVCCCICWILFCWCLLCWYLWLLCFWLYWWCSFVGFWVLIWLSCGLGLCLVCIVWICWESLVLWCLDRFLGCVFMFVLVYCLFCGFVDCFGMFGFWIWFWIWLCWMVEYGCYGFWCCFWWMFLCLLFLVRYCYVWVLDSNCLNVEFVCMCICSLVLVFCVVLGWIFVDEGGLMLGFCFLFVYWSWFVCVWILICGRCVVIYGFFWRDEVFFCIDWVVFLERWFGCVVWFSLCFVGILWVVWFWVWWLVCIVWCLWYCWCLLYVWCLDWYCVVILWSGSNFFWSFLGCELWELLVGLIVFMLVWRSGWLVVNCCLVWIVRGV